MDYVYLVDLKSYFDQDEIKLNDQCICTLSNRNILALSNDCCVYILPLEKPNELIPVTLSSSPCESMCWSDDGLFLLNVYKNGVCDLYNLKTSSLNIVDSVYTFRIDGDNVAMVKAFSKSPKLCLNYEKRDSPNYLEKFFHKPFNCLKNFGKFAYNGFLLLTKSATFHVCLLDYNTVKCRFEKFEYDMKLVIGSKEKSNEPANVMMTDDDAYSTNKSFDLADFSFQTDGSIIAAFTNYDIRSPILIYKVNLKLSIDSMTLDGTNELMATINIESTIGAMTAKTNMLFTSNESAQHICLSLRSEQMGCDLIQVWQPSQMDHNLIGSFDFNSASSEQWTLVKLIESTSSLIHMCVPKCAVNFKDFNDPRQTSEPLYLLVCYQNGTSGFIDLQNFNQTLTSVVPMRSKDRTSSGADEEKSKKTRLATEFIMKLDQSLTGSIGVGLTNSCRLVVFRQPLFRELTHNQSGTLNYMQNLYEFCMLTGYDYWDLLVNTNPNKIVDLLIERLESQYQNQMPVSIQKVYFSRHYSLIYSLYCRREVGNGSRSLSRNSNASPTPASTLQIGDEFKSAELLAKLVLNRCMSLLTLSIQYVINFEAYLPAIAANAATSSMVNSRLMPPILNTTLVTSVSSSDASSSAIFNQIQSKTNLSDYMNEFVKLDNLKNENGKQRASMSLNDIVQALVNKKNTSIVLSQHVKHIFQWIIDLSLHLISVYVMSPIVATKQSTNTSSDGTQWIQQYGAGLLVDLWFLNELRKAFIYMKLVLVCSSSSSPLSPSSMGNGSSQQHQSRVFMSASIPTLPVRTSLQKDLIGELYAVFTKLVVKNLEGKNVFYDEALMNQCTALKIDTISHSISDQLTPVKIPWLGKANENWNQTLQMEVDDLFPAETIRRSYPFFDLVRLINFGRSTLTKQCIRCGNFTESQPTQVSPVVNGQLSSKSNCVFVQDVCSEKCLCGGFWVLSNLQ